MRSCIHYTPNAASFELHEGLDIDPDYDFDRAFPVPSCSHPEFVGTQVIATCQYERDQVNCPLYEPEPDTVLRWVEFSHTHFEELQLVRRRVQFGIVEYHVTLHEMHGEEEEEELEEELESAAPRTLHRVSAHDHGDSAIEMAEELFEYEIQQRSEHEKNELQPSPPVPAPSYLLEVAS